MKKKLSVSTAPAGTRGGAVLKAVFLSYLVTAVLLLIISFIMFRLDPPETIARAGVIITYIISCFAGGFLMGKHTERHRFLWGLITGLIYFVILFLVSLLLGHLILTQIPSILTVLLMCGLGGTLGGMLS